MNFFEQELRKLFGDGNIIESPEFVGRTCLGALDGDLRCGQNLLRRAQRAATMLCG